MKTFGERIVLARATARLKQKDVADHFGIRPVSVHQWEVGQTQPDPRKITALAGLLGVSVEWLLSGHGEMMKLPHGPDDRSGAGGAGRTAPPESYVAVKMAAVRPGMGGPADAFVEDETQYSYFPAGLIAELRARPEDLWVMQVEGQSMSPYLEAGDMVMVDSTRTSPSQPGVFVVWDGFGMVCKWAERVMPSDPPAIRLISQNPMFKPVELTVGEPGEAEAYIMGRVVWMSRKV